jgi:hypothetical protein
MTSISERYSTARNTSNLKSEPRTSMAPADVLAAAGMAAQSHETALMLWEVAFRGKTSAKLKLVEMLANRLTEYMSRERIKGRPVRIAMEVLAWHLHGICRPCNGLGYEQIPETPSLSDVICRHCNGTRKVALPRGEEYTWLADHIGKLEAHAGGHVMQKLAGEMDL